MTDASRAWRAAVHILCGYELIAMHTPLPTITRLAWQYRCSWPGRAVLAAGFAGLGFHLCIDGKVAA